MYTKEQSRIINRAILDFKKKGMAISVFEDFVRDNTIPELKPCPFCGGKATKRVDRGKHRVECCNLLACSMQTAWWHNEGSAVEAWNRRA